MLSWCSELNCVGPEIGYTNEPPRGKINNVISEQVQHKPVREDTEAG